MQFHPIGRTQKVGVQQVKVGQHIASFQVGMQLAGRQWADTSDAGAVMSQQVATQQLLALKGSISDSTGANQIYQKIAVILQKELAQKMLLANLRKDAAKCADCRQQLDKALQDNKDYVKMLLGAGLNPQGH